VARLQGNYEGAVRNDNGQTDPSISSLFCFTPGGLGLLGDQFAVGALNTDRRGVGHGFFFFTFDHRLVESLTPGHGVPLPSGTTASRVVRRSASSPTIQPTETQARCRSVAVASWAARRSPVPWTCTANTPTSSRSATRSTLARTCSTWRTLSPSLVSTRTAT